jgi:hypothetical protein
MDWWRGDLEGTPLPKGFAYTSATNTEWLGVAELRTMLARELG